MANMSPQLKEALEANELKTRINQTLHTENTDLRAEIKVLRTLYQDLMTRLIGTKS